MAPGNTMIEHFLDVHGLLPKNVSKTDLYIVVIGDALDDARRVAYEFRQAGLNVEVDITSRKLDKQIKTAMKKNIKHLLFIGEKDAESGEYSLKNLDEETEEKLTPEQVIEKLQL
jgi:histidyl-tRNA synthetase